MSSLTKNASLWSLRLVKPIFDPKQAVTGLAQYAYYLSSWIKYARLSGAESIKLANAFPQLHDRTKMHDLDAHYFYTNGWAMRRIVATKPIKHVDVGSEIIFANLLSAVIPTTFVDYRPLSARISGLTCADGDILAMPYEDDSVQSLSCLHVAEHIGLGRYGDPLNPNGTKKATQELTRILAPGGNLFFVVPVGKPCLCFNAHRIHAPQVIREYFADLELYEFSGVNDYGHFAEHIDLLALSDNNYGCGMYWFKKRL